jgi:charged multivesicular body protein 6
MGIFSSKSKANSNAKSSTNRGTQNQNANRSDSGGKKGTSAASGSPGGITEYDRAVLDLKLQRDKLNKHAKAINRFSEKQNELAKSLLKEGKKDAALICLKRRKLHESQLKKVENLMENIQKMIDTVEFATIQQEVALALKSGTTALQELQKNMSLDEIEKIHDDAADAVALTKEMGDLLAQSLTAHDEEAIEEELAALELSLAPKVPSTKLPEIQQKDPQQVREENVATAAAEAQEEATEEQEEEEPVREKVVALA